MTTQTNSGIHEVEMKRAVPNSPLGRKVRELREERGWTQSQLAEIADVEERTIQNVEGKGRARLETCQALAAAFGLEAGEFTRLMKAATSSEASSPGTLESYRERFKSIRSRGLSPLVPLKARGSAETVPAKLDANLRAGHHTVIFGPSGTGKSHATLHAALMLCDAAKLPLFARARDYEGNLSEWLDMGVGPFTDSRAIDLLELARGEGAAVVLFVDDVQGCPADLREKFFGELTAFARRPRTVIVFTDEREDSCLQFGKLTAIEAGVPNGSERERLLDVYNLPATDRDAAMEVVSALSSAFEVSLAAKCWKGLSASPTRHQLLHAYVREVLDRGGSGPQAFDALCRIADGMSKAVRRTADLPAIFREISTLGTEANSTWKLILESRLVRIENLRVAFQHELLRQFFAAEAVMRSASDQTILAMRVDLPIYQELSPLVVEAQVSQEAFSELFWKSVQVRGLASSLENGAHGVMAQQAMSAIREATFAAAKDVIGDMRCTMLDEPNMFGSKFQFEFERELTPEQSDFLVHIGATACEPDYVSPCLELFGDLDQWIERTALRLSTLDDGERRRVRRQLTTAVLHRPSGKDIPITPLLQGVQTRSLEVRSMSDLRIWMSKVAELGPTQLSVLCMLVRQSRLREGVEDWS